MMSRVPQIFLLIVGLLLGACQTLDVGDAIGASALAVTTTARAVTAECGNTQPDGPCQPESWISTSDKQSLKERLRAARDAIHAAEDAYVNGRDAAGFLGTANALLSGVRQFLTTRGIE